MKITTPADLAPFIDHTLLKADATSEELEMLCREAVELGFHSVCVSGCRVEEAYSWLEETDVQVCTVVGFPLGNMDSDAKRYETEAAVDNGASEIDMVMNVGWLKDRQDKRLLREFRDVVEAAEDRIVKVILETCLLTREEIIRASELVRASGAHFVKTSTGFAKGGATVQDIQLMRDTVGESFGVKASGGIRDTRKAAAMIEAGATRLGTSASVAIVSGSLDGDFDGGSGPNPGINPDLSGPGAGRY